jgi:hypothetical protein
MSNKRKSIYKKRGEQIEDYKVIEKFNEENSEKAQKVLQEVLVPVFKDLLIHNKGLKD